jgi:hypothetical protein
MSITAIPPFFLPPILEAINTLTPTFSAAQNINTANLANGWTVRIPKTGTLDTFEFRSGTTSSFPTNGIRVSFQDINSSGFPDGSVDQYVVISSGGSYPNNTWIDPGLMTHNGTSGGTKRSVTVGDYLSIVIENNPTYSAGSFQFSSVNLAALTDQGIDGQSGFINRDSALTWTYAANKRGFGALRYNDGTYAVLGHPKYYPFMAFASATFNSGSTPDERGLRLILPASLRICGFWLRGTITAAADIVLYDAGGSVVLTSTITPYVFNQSYVIPVTPTTLASGVVYRLVLKPTSGSNVTLYDFSANTNALLGATNAGVDWYYTERTNAGAWTDTNTKCPWMGLIVDGVDTVSVSIGGSYGFA